MRRVSPSSAIPSKRAHAVTSSTEKTMEAKVSRRVARNAPLILALNNASEAVKNSALAKASRDFILSLVEIAHNVIYGVVRVTAAHSSALRRHRKDLTDLLRKTTPLTKQKRILQKGGILGLLVKPVLSILGGLLGGGLGGRRR